MLHSTDLERLTNKEDWMRERTDPWKDFASGLGSGEDQAVVVGEDWSIGMDNWNWKAFERSGPTQVQNPQHQLSPGHRESQRPK